MKKHFSAKSFVLGLLISALAFSLMTTAIAASRSKQVTAEYPGVKISVNGEIVTPTTADGTEVEPFIIDGTTYLPVRGVASLLGADVGWDQETKTVILTTGAAKVPAGTEIFKKDGLTIYFMGFQMPGKYESGDCCISLKLVNESDKKYTVHIRDLSANDTMVNTSSFYCDVAAGKTANDKVTLFNLEGNGISLPLTSAEFYFTVYSDGLNHEFDSEIIKLG